MRASVEESVTRLIRQGEERAAETRSSLQAWFDANTSALEEFQQRIDERARQAVTTLDPFGGARRQLEELTARIERIEAHLGLEPLPMQSEEESSEEPTER